MTSHISVVDFIMGALTSPVETLTSVWEVLPSPTYEAWCIWMGYVGILFVLAIIVPGKTAKGAVLEDGSQLTYKINGLQSVLVFIALFLGAVYMEVLPGSIVVDHIGPLVAVSHIFSLIHTLLCLVIPAIKGTAVSEGNPIKDFWMGTWLNPRLLGVDLKTFAYRPSMAGWALINLSVAIKQWELYGYITTPMLLFQFFSMWYIMDYFLLEKNVIKMYDIIEERFGFMLIWGDYCFITFTFSLNSWYFLHHLEPMSTIHACICVALFFMGFTVFRVANSQKAAIKADRKALINGKEPEYVDGRLLVSGFWGFVRKPNYLGDLMIALSFGSPAGFSGLLPYSYFTYLLLLLLHRARRDEARCAAKYGLTWDKYTARVPYRIFKFIY